VTIALFDDTPAAVAPRPLRSLPSPPGLPVVGHLTRLDPLHLHRQLEAWFEQLGPLYRLNLAGSPVLVFHDAAAMQAVLRERPHAVSRNAVLRPIFREMGADGLFSAEGADWQPQRRLIMASLNATHFRGFFPTLRAITDRLHRRWCAAADRGEVLEMTQELIRFTVDVTSALAFGEDPNTLEQQGNVIQDHLAAIFPMVMKRALSPLPYWRWMGGALKLPADRALDRHLEAVHAYVHQRIAAARARLAADRPEVPRHALEAMLMEAARPGSGFTDELIAANVLTLLLAGEDTTAHGLAWSLLHLSRDGALQQQLHEAARAALGPEAVCTRHEQLRTLDAFEGVALEAMRLNPVVAFFGMQALKPMVVAGVAVPAGTKLFYVSRPAQTDSAHFAEPARFDPARWHRSGDGAAHDPRAYLQFGAGPRVCPGRHLATQELRIVLAMLLHEFEVQLACDEADIDELLHFTNLPSRMPVRLRRRAAAQAGAAAGPAVARCPFGHG
jgi:cytochrome P450